MIDFTAVAMVPTPHSLSNPLKRPNALTLVRAWLRRNAREAWHLHRRMTVAVITCAIASASLWIFVIPQQLAEIQRLRVANAQLRSEQVGADSTSSEPRRDIYDVSAFPMRSSSAEVIAAIATHADRSGLDIDSITSHPVHMESGLLIRTEVAFVAVGTFKKTRTLIAALLSTYPTLSLDMLDVARDDIESPTVSTSVRLSYFSRP